MKYLTSADAIRTQINQLTSLKILWVDTEIADWNTYQPRLSIIQVLSNSQDRTGDSAYIFDVLDKTDLTSYFIQQIMLNPQIEKVFHNASFDLKYLGGEYAKNITCTLKIARKINKNNLQVSNLKLKTLASELCKFSNVDTEEQVSDWGQRPLTQKQLQYAAMDTVYLAAVHQKLLTVSQYNLGNSIFEMAGSGESVEKLESFSLTATKVRVAFECPRLFYLNHHFGGNTLFIPSNSANGIGKIFHHLADEFLHLAINEPLFIDIFKPAASHLLVEEVALAMQQIYYQNKFSSYLQKSIDKDINLAQPLLKVWQGLQGLIQRFAELLVTNRRFCSPETLIRNTFVAEERKLEHYFNLSNNSKQRVTGEFDCLVFNCELKRLCVIEFKTYQPVDPSAQLSQVALYSYMLWQNKKVAVDSAVYCVLPEFKEYYYSWEQLENTVHQLIKRKLQQMQQWLAWKSPSLNPPPLTTQPHLCEICPQQQKCQSYFALGSPQDTGDNNTEDIQDVDISKNGHTTNTDEQTTNANQIGEQLVTTLKSFGIGVDFQGVATAPAFLRVKLKPHPGIKVNAILKLSADLQVQMSLGNSPLIAPQAGYISIDLPRQDRQVAQFDNYLKSQYLPENSPIKIAIGVNLEGKLVEADLSDPNTCHFLVGGTTGSGKSEFLRALLLSLLVRHSPQHLKIALVDPKRVTFPEFEAMKWLLSPVVKDSEAAIELMENLVTEMSKRYKLFEKTGCNDLTTYNQRSQVALPRIVCIFDEYADFMAEKEIRKALELSIKRLGAMAGAAGIHLIIATQRPEASVVTPIIRSNLPGRVALRTASEADSMIILGGKQVSAAYLLGKGDLLYQTGAYLHRLQSLFAMNIQLNKI